MSYTHEQVSVDAEPKEAKPKEAKPKEAKPKEAKPKKTPVSEIKKNTQDCNICAETVSKNKCISCPYCSFECCKKCVETFLLGIEDDVPRCMNSTCKKIWSFSFLGTNFSQNFFNKEYRDRRAFLLMEKEKSRLPEAQIVLENRKREKNLRDEINTINADLRELNTRKEWIKNELFKTHVNIYRNQKNGKEQELKLKLDLKNLIFTRKIVKEKIYDKKTLKNNKHNLIRNMHTQGNNQPVERKEVIMKCPVNECRGFVNKENEEGINKCGICKVVVCKKCRVVKNDPKNHECDPDVLATIKMLAKDTKNCPNCTTPIFKINGCDQMYCTQCHTAFSWKSGLIEKGVIHNPHFYEYQRRMNNGVAPRVPGDNPRVPGDNIGCVPCWRDIQNFLDTVYSNFSKGYRTLSNAHRMIGHINQYIQNLYTLETVDLRVDYLDNVIDEKKWADTLKRRQKRAEKDNEIRQILRMVTDTFSELFRTSLIKSASINLANINSASNENKSDRNKIIVFCEELLDGLKKVCTYANEALSVIEKQYNNVVPYFGNNCMMYENVIIGKREELV